MASTAKVVGRRLSSFFSPEKREFDVTDIQPDHAFRPQPHSPNPSLSPKNCVGDPDRPDLRPLPLQGLPRDRSPASQNRNDSSVETTSSSQIFYATQGNPSPAGTPSFGPTHQSAFNEDGILLPPPRIGDAYPELQSSGGSRPQSRSGSPQSNRPASPGWDPRPLTPTSGLVKKRTWLPGSKAHTRNDSTSSSPEINLGRAWVVGPDGSMPYDLDPLLSSRIVPELWQEGGNTYVHLYPTSGKGPSFRLPSSTIASSKALTVLAHGGLYNERSASVDSPRAPKTAMHARQQSLGVPGSMTSPLSPVRGSLSSRDSSEGSSRIPVDALEDSDSEIHLYMPLGISVAPGSSNATPEDIETLIALRNLFAFLVGQSLVATPKQPNLFSILLNIAGHLQHYEFSNFDGSTLGELPDSSFSQYVEELGLADIRANPEKTLEAIVLGEKFRSFQLYNEGFVHGVGKLDEIKALRSPKYELISKVTQKRLERASIDLHHRLKGVQTRLDDFDFPSLFAGTANSTSSGGLNFKAWKSSFMSMRKHTMSLYRSRYGSWPPKAKSKKNDFEESGLNRVLLKDVYCDFCDLYDLLVDRSSFTTRGSLIPGPRQPTSSSSNEGAHRALREIEHEFDVSAPPTQPPVPFDVPLIPSLLATRRGHSTLSAKKQTKESSKKLQDNEINQALMQSYNRDSLRPTDFLENFMSFERNSAHGKSMDDIADLRAGQWIFVYAVLQSLPMLVVDAPGVQYRQGTEYFLCEPPKGGVPWIERDATAKKAWYGITGGSGMVSLPADVVDHGVEGIYRRSHCWRTALLWIAEQQGSAEDERAGRSRLHNPTLTQSKQSTLPALATAPPGFQSFSQRSGSAVSSHHLDQSVPATPPIFVREATYSPAPRSGSLPPPPGMSDVEVGNRKRDSLSVGLEALPLPSGVSPIGRNPTTPSTYDPTKSFEDILGATSGPGKGKKK
ncbi:hypothetical protein MMC09_005898 [Bachmanniomyces sp. S44760]|nr:hypothetical protein [Bachmanniomyces sp. S44760]